MKEAAKITEEIRALERLDLEGLRAEWRRRYGQPPKARSPELVRLTLAWRIQADAFGGLDTVSQRRIRQAKGAPARADHLGVGARITREWRGVLYEIDRVADGLKWQGKVYPSLSAVAQAITGVKRNGPKFFGLREASQN